MQQKNILLTVLIVLTVFFTLVGSLRTALPIEKAGDTIVKVPSYDAYDRSKFPDRNKLLLAAEYLSSISSSSTFFLESKKSTRIKILRAIPSKDDSKIEPVLQKLREEKIIELEELKGINLPEDLKNLNSQRLLFIIVGDWKLLTQANVTLKIKYSIDNKFEELGIPFPTELWIMTQNVTEKILIPFRFIALIWVYTGLWLGIIMVILALLTTDKFKKKKYFMWAMIGFAGVALLGVLGVTI